MLMKLVRSTDIRVTLDGTGSDELFGGYDWYIPLAIRDSFHSLRICEAMGNIEGWRSKHGKSWLIGIEHSLFPGFTQTIRSIRGRPRPWHSRLFQSELRPRHVPAVQGRNFLDRALKVDLLQYNTPRWVNMIDRISMAHAIISRSPFLDYRLVEFAFSLDNSLKIRNAETKYVLREAKRNVLPASIVNDHKKVQFDGPATQWLKGSLKNFVLSLRDGKDAKLSGLLRADHLSDFIDDFFRSERPNPARMWRIVSSEAFLRAYS